MTTKIALEVPLRKKIDGKWMNITVGDLEVWEYGEDEDRGWAWSCRCGESIGEYSCSSKALAGLQAHIKEECQEVVF